MNNARTSIINVCVVQEHAIKFIVQEHGKIMCCPGTDKIVVL